MPTGDERLQFRRGQRMLKEETLADRATHRAQGGHLLRALDALGHDGNA